MSPAEHDRATHGRNIPYARFGGRHSEGTAPGTDTQQLYANQSPHFERPPSWDQVTDRFFTVPPRQRTETDGRHRVVSPLELLNAGLNAATAASRVTNNEELTEYLRQQHEQLPEITTPPELMALTAAHFVRLGVRRREIHTLLEGLAYSDNRDELLPDFYEAFRNADSLGVAVSRLPWEKAAQYSG